MEQPKGSYKKNGSVLKPDQRSLLAPHAKHFMAMSLYVQESSDEEIDALLDACNATTQANCSWDIYQAAQALRREIAVRQRAKAQRVRTLKYVVFSQIDDYLKLGWHFVGPCSEYSVYMEWLCNCSLAMPKYESD